MDILLTEYKPYQDKLGYDKQLEVLRQELSELAKEAEKEGGITISEMNQQKRKIIKLATICLQTEGCIERKGMASAEVTVSSTI